MQLQITVAMTFSRIGGSNDKIKFSGTTALYLAKWTVNKYT